MIYFTLLYFLQEYTGQLELPGLLPELRECLKAASKEATDLKVLTSLQEDVEDKILPVDILRIFLVEALQVLENAIAGGRPDGQQAGNIDTYSA